MFLQHFMQSLLIVLAALSHPYGMRISYTCCSGSGELNSWCLTSWCHYSCLHSMELPMFFFSPLRSHTLEALQWPLLHRATNSLPLWEQRKDDGLFCQLWTQLQAAVALTMAGPTLALCRYVNCFCFLTTWGKKLLSEWSQMHRVMLKDLQPLCKELQPETLEEAHKTFVEFIPGN